MNSVEPVFKCPLKCNEIIEKKPDVLRHLESAYHKYYDLYRKIPDREYDNQEQEGN